MHSPGICVTHPSSEKQISENDDKLSDEDKAPLNASIEKLQQAITTEDTESIKSATAELEQAAQAFGKVLYEKAGAAGAAPDAPEAAAEAQPWR